MAITASQILTAMATFGGVVSAMLWRAASIFVPDNIDTFINELQRAGRWNSWAAPSAPITAALSVAASLAAHLA